MMLSAKPFAVKSDSGNAGGADLRPHVANAAPAETGRQTLQATVPDAGHQPQKHTPTASTKPQRPARQRDMCPGNELDYTSTAAALAAVSREERDAAAAGLPVSPLLPLPHRRHGAGPLRGVGQHRWLAGQCASLFRLLLLKPSVCLQPGQCVDGFVNGRSM